MSESPRPEAFGTISRLLSKVSTEDGTTSSVRESWVPPPPDRPLPDEGAREPFGPLEAMLGTEEPAASGRLDSPGERVPAPPGFVLLAECGRGAMGLVYLAEQVGLGRRVALKFLKPELATSDQERARFRTEANALARLQHPNIVQVFDCGTHEGRAYIVQEYVAGGNLEEKLAGKPQPAIAAAQLVATLARAVAHAHAQKIIHRDLKPSNTLLTEEGIPKISDFGLARQIDAGADSGQTRSGVILGSPSYMAPEQAIGKNSAVGPAVDVYALGAILYEIVTGRPPFLGASVIETLEAVRQLDPVPPRQLQSALPRDLETICLKCLAKSPGRRYLSAAALAEDLDRFARGQPILARPASALERLTKWVRRHPATAASLAVASMAAMGLLVGGVVYEALLRQALKDARSNAAVAREQKKKSDTRYRLARNSLNKMLARLDDPSFSQAPRVKELKRGQLEDSLSFYQAVVEDLEDDSPAVRFDVAEAYIQAGYNQIQLDRSAEGREQLTKALAILERLVNEDPARPEYRFALARTSRDLGLPLAQAISRTAPAHSFTQPEELLRRSVALFEDLIRESPERRDYTVDLARAQNALGVYFEGYSASVSGWAPTQNLGESARWFQRAAESYRSLLGHSPSAEDLGFRIQLALNLQNAALIGSRTEHSANVQRDYFESHQLLTDVLQIEPKNDDALVTLGITLLNWGSDLLTNAATRAKGVRLILEAIERFKPLVDREPTWAKPRFFLGDCYRTLAEFHDAEGRFVEALRYWDSGTALADGEPKEELRTCQALDLSRLGQHRKAWNLVRSLEPALATLVQHYHYSHRLVAACSLCMDAAEKDQSLPAGERGTLSIQYGDKGADLLRRVLELAPLRIVPATAGNCGRTRRWRLCSAAKTFRRCSQTRRWILQSALMALQSLATVGEQIEIDQLFNENVAILGHDRTANFVE